MAKKEQREFYCQLKAEGKLTGTIANAMRLRAAREDNPPLRQPSRYASGRILRLNEQRRLKRSQPVVVPLGDEQERYWLDKAQSQNRRLREWSLGAEASAGRTRPYVLREIGSNSNRRKRSTFQRGIWVRSTATCYDFRVCVLELGSKRHEIKAPRGYRWDVDENGLYLRGRAGDYHPTASELLAGGKEIARKLRKNAAIRKAERKKAKQQKAAIQKAEKEGATVCLRDSLNAGNCRPGSVNWAKRHGIDPQKHYTPSRLLSLANGDASRVALVVSVALRRHRQEMDRGFSELAYHRV